LNTVALHFTAVSEAYYASKSSQAHKSELKLCFFFRLFFQGQLIELNFTTAPFLLSDPDT
jgi:hypothetical protein